MSLRLYDMHTHSRHSFDGSETVDDLCRAAIDRELSGIAITDHVDFGIQRTENWRQLLASMLPDSAAASGPDFETRLAGYWREALSRSLDAVADAAQHVGDRLDVLRGVEIGQPLQDETLARETVEDNRFDVVVMALHNLESWPDFYFLDMNIIDLDEMMRLYFGELYRMACWGRFDVLAHIGYPLRYIRRDTGRDWDLAPYRDQIDAIYGQLIDTGKALEVNTAALSRGTGHITPDLAGLKRYRDLGGELVTLGSDAHAARFVGGCFDAGIELLRSAGFRYVAHYKDRKPILTTIE